MGSNVISQALTAPLLGFALVYLLLLSPWRPKRLRQLISPTLEIFTAVTLAFGLISIHQPAPLERAASALVAYTGLPEQMTELDGRIHSLETLPSRTWNALILRLGFADEDAELAEPAPDPGPVREQLLPAVEELVSGLLRIFVYGSSLMAMALALVLRVWSTTTFRISEGGRRRQAGLEDRIQQLELAMSQWTSASGSLPGTAR